MHEAPRSRDSSISCALSSKIKIPPSKLQLRFSPQPHPSRDSHRGRIAIFPSLSLRLLSPAVQRGGPGHPGVLEGGPERGIAGSRVQVLLSVGVETLLDADVGARLAPEVLGRLGQAGSFAAQLQGAAGGAVLHRVVLKRPRGARRSEEAEGPAGKAQSGKVSLVPPSLGSSELALCPSPRFPAGGSSVI